MPNCPVCGKWFSSEFAMKGHLRLSNDDRHISYTGKKTSRKYVGGVSVNLSKQTESALLGAVSRLEAKLDMLNKPQQPAVTKTETPAASANLSKQTESALLDAIHRLDAIVDKLNKPRQQFSIKTDVPVVPQQKKTNWWEYTNTEKTSKSRSVFAPSDEYLNSLVETGFSPEYVRGRALGKYYKSSSDENEE